MVEEKENRKREGTMLLLLLLCCSLCGTFGLANYRVGSQTVGDLCGPYFTATQCP